VNTTEAERIARNESAFRDVNEGIAKTAERLQASETAFICECADPACTDRIEATLAEYEEAREQGTTFLLVPGHEDERIETVVELNGEHAVVEKRHPATVRVALALNPRAD
jgi:hypothetical protein